VPLAPEFVHAITTVKNDPLGCQAALLAARVDASDLRRQVTFCVALQVWLVAVLAVPVLLDNKVEFRDAWEGGVPV
jgi:hypothetical protein